MNQAFVCCSTYHVYVAILEAYRNKKTGRETVLFFYTDIIQGINPFLDQVEKIGVFKDVVRISGYSLVRKLWKKHGLLTYLFSRKQLYLDVFHEANPNLIAWDSFLQKAEINLFQINRTRAFFLIKYPNNFFRMYEDGLGTYTQKLHLLRKINRTYFTRFPLLKGHDPQVKEVFVSTPGKVRDKVLIPKLKQLSLGALEEQLSDEEGRLIIHLLAGGVTLPDKEFALIITQPLSEDKYCLESTKVRLYQNLAMEQINAGLDVLVKTHPREKTAYQIAGSNIHFLPRYFPLEVLNLDRRLKIKTGISFFSTALQNLKNVEERIFLGEEYAKAAIKEIESTL